jgi:hypothetical protein
MASVEEAVAVQNANERALLARRGVTGVGVGYKETGGRRTETVSILVFVESKTAADRLSDEERIPSEIAGVPTDVLVKGRDLLGAPVEAPDPTTAPRDVPDPDTGRYRPVVSGCQIQRVGFLSGSTWLGTVGCFVKRKRLDGAVDDQDFLLTCSHVLNPPYPPGSRMADDDVYQAASFLGGNLIGWARDYVFHDGGNVDAGLAWIWAGTEIKNYVQDVGDITAPGEVALGDVVVKRGRTTLKTTGTVIAVNYTSKLSGSNFTIRDGFAVLSSDTDPFCQPGDSGSLVVRTLSGDRCQPVGLLFALSESTNYGIVNRISNVLSALDVYITPTVD